MFFVADGSLPKLGFKASLVTKTIGLLLLFPFLYFILDQLVEEQLWQTRETSTWEVRSSRRTNGQSRS